jgi:hypothetical protein
VAAPVVGVPVEGVVVAVLEFVVAEVGPVLPVWPVDPEDPRMPPTAAFWFAVG